MKIIENDEAVSPVKTVSTEDAVSPVIGVILMVAITVILAAVIAAFVFGMAGTTSTTKTVGMTLTANQTNPIGFKIVFTGGADLSSVEALIINYDNVATGLDDAETDLAGDPAAVSVVVGPTAGVNNKIALDIANNKRFATGNQLNVAMADAGDVIQGHRITAIGVFADGSQQILLDKTL